MGSVVDISKQNVCYSLPTSVDTRVFGPDFWAAFADLADKVPCGGCKEESKSFVSFWHDLKNGDLGKPIYDQKNYNAWIEKIGALGTARKAAMENKLILGLIGVVLVVVLIVVLAKK